MNQGRSNDREGTNPRLQWDGTQFMPTNTEPAPAEPTGSTFERAQWWDWTPVWLASISMVLVVGLCTTIFVSVDMGWGTKILSLAVVWSLPVGLALWFRTDYVRNRPIPDRWRSLDSNERFARVLRFSEAELATNREGRMSVLQRLRILRGDIAWWLAALSCIGGGPASLVVFALKDSISIKAVIIALFVIGAGCWALYRASSAGMDALRGRLHGQDTHLHPFVKHGNWLESMSFFRLRTDDGVQLKVPHAAFGAVDDGVRYRIHFAPLSRILVSVEVA